MNKTPIIDNFYKRHRYKEEFLTVLLSGPDYEV